MKIQVIQIISYGILLITVDVLALIDHAQLTAMRFHYHYEEKKTRLVLEFSEKVNYIEKKGPNQVTLQIFDLVISPQIEPSIQINTFNPILKKNMNFLELPDNRFIFTFPLRVLTEPKIFVMTNPDRIVIDLFQRQDFKSQIQVKKRLETFKTGWVKTKNIRMPEESFSTKKKIQKQTTPLNTINTLEQGKFKNVALVINKMDKTTPAPPLQILSEKYLDEQNSKRLPIDYGNNTVTIGGRFESVALVINKVVKIPSGKLQIRNHNGMQNEVPTHTIHINTFYIDKYEVTIGQYKRFIQATHYPEPNWDEIKEYAPADNNSIVYISWYDAMAYAKWTGKRLPTENEWEYAARGGISGKKEDLRNEGETGDDVANISKLPKTKPVGVSYTNGYGLHDMSGNMREWCLDSYDENHNRRSLQVKLQSKDSRTFRVVREGPSWIDQVHGSQPYRSFYLPSHHGNDIGFRCATDIPPSAR